MNQCFVFIGGFKDPPEGGTACPDTEDGDGYKMNTKMRAIALARAGGKFLGLFGTIHSNADVDTGWGNFSRFITSNVTPDGKLIIYGYSAGGNNALEFCRRIDRANQSSLQSRPVKVDLLITIDPAGRIDETVKPDGRVAACVVKNVNYYQTSPFSYARSVKTSSSAPGMGGAAQSISNTDLTDSLSGSGSKHHLIEGYTLQTATDLLNAA